MKHINIMKQIGLAAMLIVPFVGADAAPLTPQAALQRAVGEAGPRRISSNVNYSLSYTATNDGEDCLYVFNKGDRGYLILSADDRMPAILGYSDAGAFDFDAAPPQLKWWLGEYAAEASVLIKDGNLQGAANRAAAERASIAPMVKSKWGQNEPFNLACPEDDGGRVVTGCVATAMAQIIRYHGYPVKGKGTHSYDWRHWSGLNIVTDKLSFDYGATTFDYANMLDEYTNAGNNATAAQRDAVAKLMYACGVSVNMGYSSGMSSASDYAIPYAFTQLFNYDSGVKYVKRAYYTTAEWEDLVYSELAANRPVIYGGQAPDGGHEFVCDGYDQGYFHINWGWNGSFDGYFLLSNLLPEGQGTGGFAGGYNSDQGIVMGIKPAASTTDVTPNIVITGGLDVDLEETGGGVVYIEIEGGMICNFGPVDCTVPLAFKMVGKDGKEYLGAPADYKFQGAMSSVIGFDWFGLYLPKGVPAGEYTATVVYKNTAGEWEDARTPISKPGYLVMTVGADGSLSFKQGEPQQRAEIKVTVFAPMEVVYPGQATPFEVTMKNLSDIEYSGAVYVRTYIHDTNQELTDAMKPLNAKLGPESELNLLYNLSYDLEEGLYDVICYDSYGEKISEIFPLWIGVPPVYVNDIVMSESEVSVEEGTTYQLTVNVYPANADNPAVVWSSSNPEVANVDENGLVTVFIPGSAVITATTTDGTELSAQCVITATSGIEDILADDATAAVYTLDGNLVNVAADKAALTALPKGLYIIRTANKTYKLIK